MTPARRIRKALRELDGAIERGEVTPTQEEARAVGVLRGMAAGRREDALRKLVLVAQCSEFNRRVPVGTRVCYWPGIRDGLGILSQTRTPAQVLGGHTPVVWVEGRTDCIALSHVEIA